MKIGNERSIVSTKPEKCKVCFTCVRECPAKAIKIVNGQAQVIGDRCIGCGLCVKVCSQKAKEVFSDIEGVELLLSGKEDTAAIIAPSFPAEFYEDDYGKLVGAVRKLGFKYVYEVGFGADIVALKYKELLESSVQAYIASTCPAIVAYVEKYYPDLTPRLAPVVSPMIAMARVVRRIHKGKINIVFIGPCIAKKGEKERKLFKKDVQCVLIYSELRELFKKKNIEINTQESSVFDEPVAAKGGLFPLSRGMLETASIHENLVENNVISADGKMNFVEAIKEFGEGYLKTKLLDTLCCEGCIMGAGFTSRLPLYKRRYFVASYVSDKLESLNTEVWQSNIDTYWNGDYSTSFAPNDQRIFSPSEDKLNDILFRMGKKGPEDLLNCGACGYATCVEHAVAIYKGFAENEMCLPYTIDKLKETVNDLEKSYTELESVKEALIQREKLASMGQLAAGIAHEINNPLGIILVYSHLLRQDLSMFPERIKDVEMIVEQSERCKKIVSNLLNFSRQNRTLRNPTDVIQLVTHCLDSVIAPDDVEIKFQHDVPKCIVYIDQDQIFQVITNLVNNAVDAVCDNAGKPKVVTVSVLEVNAEIHIIVEDNGTGISEENMKNIFDPFFTTKQIGKGTGLGLPVSYGIIKMHSGRISVQSEHGMDKPTGTRVLVELPVKYRGELKDEKNIAG
ncbi:MAG: ATP-binding protein [Oligoflexia bacterium]|nr:ATP-binding protein [Oligoflexia bacterium]